MTIHLPLALGYLYIGLYCARRLPNHPRRWLVVFDWLPRLCGFLLASWIFYEDKITK